MTFRDISLFSVGFKHNLLLAQDLLLWIFFAAMIKPRSTDRGAHFLTYSQYKIKDSSSCAYGELGWAKP